MATNDDDDDDDNGRPVGVVQPTRVASAPERYLRLAVGNRPGIIIRFIYSIRQT